MTEEQTKSHALGTISLDKTGMWHCHYIGYYLSPVTKQPAFGNWLESSYNLMKLLEVIGSRLSVAKDGYLEKITNVEDKVNVAITANSPETPIQ